MKEYEYSKKVENLTYYFNYCKNNGYLLVEKSTQIRTIYRNNNKTMARITINKIGRKTIKKLDFKEDKLTNEELIERKESLPIVFTDDKAVHSILDFLEYKKDNSMNRVRYTYEKKDSTFEFDEYIEPEKVCVVSLEGKKEVVDLIWKEINND